MKKWDRGKRDVRWGGRELANFPNAPGAVKGERSIFSKTCSSAHCCCSASTRRDISLARGGDGAAGLSSVARALVLEAGSRMRSSEVGHFHGYLCRGRAWCAAFATAQRWPQPWALRELAALHIIKFLTRHSPSLAPGTAASAKIRRDIAALRVKGDIPGSGQSPGVSRREGYVCGIPPWAAALGERKKLVLGKAAAALPALSLAPLTSTMPDPWRESPGLAELRCSCAPWSLAVWFHIKK